jgi:hypothetical protein
MAEDTSQLGERFLLIRGPFPPLAPAPFYLARLGGDGIVEIVRGVEGGRDLDKLNEWLQPDVDGIKSGQLNWQKTAQDRALRQLQQPQPQQPTTGKPSQLWSGGTPPRGQ